MKNDKARKTMMTILISALLFVMAAITAYAVPARPGTNRAGAAAVCRSHHGELVTLDKIPVRESGADRAPSITPVRRDIPLLIIVVGFSNLPYENDWDWSGFIFSRGKIPFGVLFGHVLWEIHLHAGGGDRSLRYGRQLQYRGQSKRRRSACESPDRA